MLFRIVEEYNLNKKPHQNPTNLMNILKQFEREWLL